MPRTHKLVQEGVVHNTNNGLAANSEADRGSHHGESVDLESLDRQAAPVLTKLVVPSMGLSVSVEVNEYTTYSTETSAYTCSNQPTNPGRSVSDLLAFVSLLANAAVVSQGSRSW